MVLDRLVGLIAPHDCVSCGLSGRVLCQACSVFALSGQPSRCYRCHKAVSQYKTWRSCYRKDRPGHVWVACSYGALARTVIHRLKFGHSRAAAQDITPLMAEALPRTPSTTKIVHIPTVSHRARVRGFDQAELIARQLSRATGLRKERLLIRTGKSRQVGQKRLDRFKQLEGAFRSAKLDKIKGSRILLVDDVLTTGATLESATKTLKASGAKSVDAIVFAH